jgi:predicted DNA-binding transcriptional regulator
MNEIQTEIMTWARLAESITREQLEGLMNTPGKQIDSRIMGQSLRGLRQRGLLKEVVVDGIVQYSVADAPAKSTQEVAKTMHVELPKQTISAATSQLPSYLDQRHGQQVTLVLGIREYEDVVQVQAYVGSIEFKVPLFGKIRLCIGNEIPQWHPSQETIRGVTLLKLTTRSGKVFEYSFTGECLTMAPAAQS